MQQWRLLAAAAATPDQCVVADRRSVPAGPDRSSGPDLDLVLDGAARLSPEAAAHPSAMARLILRRVGITPILSLLLASLLAISPGAPAQAQSSRSLATARVIILPQAVRLEHGRVSITPHGPPLLLVESPLSSLAARPCPPQEQVSMARPCSMIITDLP